MRKILVVTACLLITGFLAGGCWATPGYVKKEISEVKGEVVIEHTKQTNEKSVQNQKKIEEINAKLEKEIMPRIAEIQSEAYKNRQNITKLLDENIAALRKDLEEIKRWIKDFEADNKK